MYLLLKIIHHKKLLSCVSLVDCAWSDWAIGECSKECGSGIRINTRIIQVNSSYGGQDCSGEHNFTEVCNVQECPGIILNSR